jgi:hypothetical protein
MAESIRDVVIRVSLEMGQIPKIELPLKEQVETVGGAIKTSVAGGIQAAVLAAKELNQEVGKTQKEGASETIRKGFESAGKAIAYTWTELGTFSQKAQEAVKSAQSFSDVDAIIKTLVADVIKMNEALGGATLSEKDAMNQLLPVIENLKAAYRDMEDQKYRAMKQGEEKQRLADLREYRQELFAARDAFKSAFSQGMNAEDARNMIDGMVEGLHKLAQEQGLQNYESGIEHVRNQLTNLVDKQEELDQQTKALWENHGAKVAAEQAAELAVKTQAAAAEQEKLNAAAARATQVDTLRMWNQEVKAVIAKLPELTQMTTDMGEIETAVQQAVQALADLAKNNGIELTASQMRQLEQDARNAADKGVNALAQELTKAGQQNFAAQQKEHMKVFGMQVDDVTESMREMAAAGTPLQAMTGVVDQAVQALVASADQMKIALSPADIEKYRRALQDAAENGADNLADANDRAARTTTAANRRQEKAWKGVFAGITQAATAASQFVALMQSMNIGEKDDLEEIAKSFIKIQATVQSLQAAHGTLQGIGKGLGDMSGLMVAASARATALAGANSMAATSYRMLGTAAAGAQALMGPLGAALMVAGLAYTALVTYTELWGDSAEDNADKARDAQERYNRSLDTTLRKLELESNAISAQSALLQSQIKLRDMLLDKDKGEAATPEQIQKDAEQQRQLLEQEQQMNFDAARAAAGKQLTDDQKALQQTLRDEIFNKSRQLEDEKKDSLTLSRMEKSGVLGMLSALSPVLGGVAGLQMWDKASSTQVKETESSRDRAMQAMEDAKAASGVKFLEQPVDIQSLIEPGKEQNVPAYLQQLANDEQRKTMRDTIMGAIQARDAITVQEKQRIEESLSIRNATAERKQAEIDDAKKRLRQDQDIEQTFGDLRAKRPSIFAQIDRQVGVLDTSRDTKTRTSAAEKLDELLSQNNLITKEQKDEVFRGSATEAGAIRKLITDNSDATDEEVAFESMVEERRKEIVLLQELIGKDLEAQTEVNKRLREAVSNKEQMIRNLRTN